MNFTIVNVNFFFTFGTRTEKSEKMMNLRLGNVFLIVPCSLFPIPYSLPYIIFNGEGGIRTHGRSPFNKFRVCRIRPLCHLSLIQLLVISYQLSVSPAKVKGLRPYFLVKSLLGLWPLR